MREREREFEGLKLFEDSSAEERYYSRSLKIRLGTMHLMKLIADRNRSAEEGKQLVEISSIDSLAGLCANWVKKGKWDKKPASEVACIRWVRQYLNVLGPFKPEPYSPGSFLITWRSELDRKEVEDTLAPYIAKWKIPQALITT